MQEENTLTSPSKRDDQTYATQGRRMCHIGKAQISINSSNTIAFLEEQIQNQRQQITYLHSLLNQRSQSIIKVQSQVSQLEQQIMIKRQEIQINTTNLQQQMLINQRLSKQAKMWKQLFSKSNEQRKQTIIQKEGLELELSTLKNDKHKILMDKQLQFSQVDNENQNSATKEQREKCVFQSLVTLQQSQLQQRNQEIARLSSNNSQQQPNHQHLKNTIKHLRNQLQRYSLLVSHTTQLLAVAEKAIQRYSAPNKDFPQSIFLKAELEDHAEKIKFLEETLNYEREEVKKSKDQQKQLKKLLSQALQQNESYRQFIFSSFDNSNEILQRQQQKYRQTQQERRETNKWASVSELIEVNQNLRKRLKLIA